MLHTQTVAPQTLGLLKQLEAEPRLAAFNLAGGTALALYLGHRVSVDLDLFTPESFDAVNLIALAALAVIDFGNIANSDTSTLSSE